ncbi:DUF6238 family protein [Streptomyces erythrochromogenes]|uniref:DUF6238 family protein n=1 Tax=Streptomyces erythrochromogenes TaxID=285574 RepID=UPI00386BC07E|nr:DUF6238 family protein [Streptomyces erythrochromogenes]
MNSSTPAGDAHPYLRAATAGVRHHARQSARTCTPADRVHLDVLHSHLTGLHLLVDRLTDTTRPQSPTAGRHLASAHLRLWQAANSLHEAFHTLPATASAGSEAGCRPDRLPEGPPVLTICQRQLASGHAIRRKTTPADHGPRPARTA